MKGKDALSQALVWFIEGKPVINARASDHKTAGDSWVIELKPEDEPYETVREVVRPEPE
jgi:hypothetical protein